MKVFLQNLIQFLRYWMNEIIDGYFILTHLSRGLPPPPPRLKSIHKKSSQIAKPIGTQQPPIPDSGTEVLEPTDPDLVISTINKMANALPEKPSDISDLPNFIEHRHDINKRFESNIQLNDPDQEAARQKRIQANLQTIARRELAMQKYIHANAERAGARKKEIEDEIRQLALRLNGLESERAALAAQNQAHNAKILEELTGSVRAIFNQIDYLEEERKFIRRTISAKIPTENALIQEMIKRQQILHEKNRQSDQGDRRVERIRRARELRIKTRAERLARMMSSRAEEIAAQKEALRLAKKHSQT